MPKKEISKPKLLKRKQSSSTTEVAVPKITNQSVAEHREEVLGKARKFIYPLKHSRKRIVKLSVGIAITAVIVFLIGSTIALYRAQSTGAFIYGVTRVLPFPVAFADGRAVSYESYLFELRHYMHYYQTQQDVDFNTDSGKRQLQVIKQRSLNLAINRAYTSILAKQNGIRVSAAEVNEKVELAKEQNRLGSSNEVFRSVLKEFWGWSIADFRHELKLELLDQKVAAALDTESVKEAEQVRQQAIAGADFGKLAAKYSDDNSTKKKDGEYGITITKSNRDLDPQIVDAVFSLKEGEISEVIDTGYTLEIIKVTKITDAKRQAAHIAINYNDISKYTLPLRTEHPPKKLINI